MECRCRRPCAPPSRLPTASFWLRALLVWLLLGPALFAAERAPWTASRVHGSPEPPAPYRVERAFPKLTFAAPLDAVVIPGTDRLVIVEQRGRLFSIPNDESCERADLFGGLKPFGRGAVECYGIAFHPQFAKNRLAFVWINLDLRGEPNREEGTRIVRFRVVAETRPTRSRQRPDNFTWLGGGPTAATLFGPMACSTFPPATPNADPRSARDGPDISDVFCCASLPDAGKPYEG